MNLGQFLTAKSPLQSGTVAQHLAAISASSGVGSDRVIYCSQFTTTLESNEISVSRKAKRTAPPNVSVTPAIVERKQKQQTNMFAFEPRRIDAVVVFEMDEIIVMQRTNVITVNHELAEKTVGHKQKRKVIDK